MFSYAVCVTGVENKNGDNHFFVKPLETFMYGLYVIRYHNIFQKPDLLSGSGCGDCTHPSAVHRLQMLGWSAAFAARPHTPHFGK